MGKRMAALALAVCMALPLFGCGGKLKAQSLTEGITARTIDTVIFDKTGTLTRGVFEVNAVHHNLSLIHI